MSEHKIKTSSYYCSKINTNVRITNRFFLHYTGSTNEVDAEFKTSFDCDHKSECGVGVSKHNATTFDWSKCIHPEL